MRDRRGADQHVLMRADRDICLCLNMSSDIVRANEHFGRRDEL